MTSAAPLLAWLSLVFAVIAGAAAMGAAVSRAHFATTLLVAAASVFVALTLMCVGAGAGALAVVLVGVGVVPVLMLGGVLLSTRALRGASRREGAPRLTVIAAAFMALALVWATGDAAPLRAPLQAPVGVGAWMAMLVFAAALTCAGVLGYGERGALARRSRGDA